MMLTRFRKLLAGRAISGAGGERADGDANPAFAGSSAYWKTRYDEGGNSGGGSYGHLAQFKAEVLNTLVAQHGVRSVIEFGCGDGNQLALASYPGYVGLDVSPRAITLCQQRFADDPTKSFFLYDSLCFVDHHGLFRADMTLSLDVIFHLVEDHIYTAYMTHLFAAAERFVVIYSSDCDEQGRQAHVRQRRFTSWISANCSSWALKQRIPNRYPLERHDGRTSFCEFFIFAKEA